MPEHKKKPVISCEKYDEEERKALIEEEERKALIEEEKKEEKAKVEPIHPSEERGGKKKGILKTCK
jgi:hypothetical protein